MNIVEIAAGDAQFSTLVAAVTAAGLVGALTGPGPFTVFAPTNAAFAALPAGTVESLLLPENKEQLTAILLFHVVSGKVMSADLMGKTMAAATLNGANLAIDATDGVHVGAGQVTAADIDASNGVIHVVDTVLMPA